MKLLCIIFLLSALLAKVHAQLEDSLDLPLDSVLSTPQLYEIHQPLIYNQPGYKERVKKYYAEKKGLYYKSAAIVLENVDKNQDSNSSFRFEDGHKNAFVFYEKMETAPAIFRRYYISFILDSLPESFEFKDEELIHLDFFATVLEGLPMSDKVRPEPRGFLRGKKTEKGYEIEMDVVAENGLECQLKKLFIVPGLELQNLVAVFNKQCPEYPFYESWDFPVKYESMDVKFWESLMDIRFYREDFQILYKDGKVALKRYPSCKPGFFEDRSWRYVESYYPNGNLHTDGDLLMHPNGVKVYERKRNKLEFFDSDQQIREKGKVSFQDEGINILREGKWKFYDKNGDLIAWYKFKNGKEVKSSSTLPFSQFTHPDYHNYFSYFEDPYQIIRD